MKRPWILPALISVVACASDTDGLVFPRPNPRASVSQVVGSTTLTLEYFRPQVRGQRIWGELVPFGQVWSTGFTEATTIRFSDPVKVNGHHVPAGNYSLLAIPNSDEWTIVLNKRCRNYGTFEYQAKDDVLRFEVKPKTLNLHTEWLTCEINPASRSSAYVDILWERLRVGFLVEVDVDTIVSSRMKRAMSHWEPDDWKLYSDAAQYYLDRGFELDQALAWADRSTRIQENPVNLSVKAKLLMELERTDLAMVLMERALRMAKSQNAFALQNSLQKTLDQWRQNPNSARNAQEN